MANRKQAKSLTATNSERSPVNRLLGVYPQRQDRLLMQRIKIPGGRISWLQWRNVAQIAVKYSRGCPLHVTTRQDIELHNLNSDDIPIIQEALAETSLTVFGTGGDSLRNITICSGCDSCQGGLDLMPLALLAQRHLEQQPTILNLPRKFKISFSGCQQACAKPWLSDLGFIAQQSGVFTVIGAGSLGPKPALGTQFYQDLPTRLVLPLCVAALELFEQRGDRENRRRARFRHARERLGDETFRTELDAKLNRCKDQQPWPDIVPAAADGKVKLLHRLQLLNGNISAREALKLADAAEPKKAILRINLEHGLELYGTSAIQLPDSLARLANNPIIVACPGSTTCPRGLANCWAAADKIRRIFTSRDTGRLRICISGCPNNCAHSAVADIGLLGTLRKEDGKPVEHYRLFTGGGNGENEKLAEQSSVIRAEDVGQAIESLLNELH